MKYSDKKTRSIVSTHNDKLDCEWSTAPVNKWNPNNRTYKRKLKKDLETFRLKMSLKNRIWYDSLTDDQRLNVFRNYDSQIFNLSYFKEKFPGDLALQRDLKLNMLC